MAQKSDPFSRSKDCLGTTSKRGKTSRFVELGVDDISRSFHGNGDLATISETSTTPCGSSNAPPDRIPSLSRFALIGLLLALVVPSFITRGAKDGGAGVEAGVLPPTYQNRATLQKRESGPADVCMRWAGSSAVVNDTIYYYGGQARISSGDRSAPWNNDFLQLDLSKSWDISSPALSALPPPSEGSGPPAVELGALWKTKTSLFQYGGEFSKEPLDPPVAVALWEYDIKAAKWIEHSDLKTVAGNNSSPPGEDVQRAAEGASLSIPDLGRSFYFGGHLDDFTTPGWSNQIARVYLKSFLEWTHPGFNNNGVTELVDSPAPDGGTFRNITQGGIQELSGFSERADGVLAYIPGWSEEGIILGLAGGTNETFTEMNVIDVYDIASSTWYKQSTQGTSPKIRVNPCVNVFAAADGSSFNVYLYGGQNLIPFGEQIQYDDMWILTVPSFTWIKVDQSGSQPPARAGHTCEAVAGKMIVLGGFNTSLTCDNPVYIFNASSLGWENSFSPTSASTSSSADKDYDILKSSEGYLVPQIVQDVVGGDGLGSATITTPIVLPTGGPFQTGSAPQFVVTGYVTSTATSAAKAKSGSSAGAISAGVVAGALAILAGYLGFCVWLYRRQLKLHKNHLQMSQRAKFNDSPENLIYARDSGSTSNEKAGVVLGPFGTPLNHSGSDRPSQGRTSTDPSSDPSSIQVTPSEWIARPAGVFGGAMVAGRGYGRLDEHGEMEYQGAGADQMYGARPTSGGTFDTTGRTAESVGTAHSSTDDLLKGQEPSFFQVVLNPRRTLKVVNSDL